MPAQGTWPSREGFTADVLGKAIQNTLLSPWKTLPLLILAHYTAKGRQTAEQHPRSLRLLRALASLAILRRLNAWLNTRTLNNGVSDQFNWHREVVVLTGGSNGIGRQIAQLLGKRGIKVAILDIQAPDTQTQSQSLPSSIHFYECDIASSSAIAAAAAEIRSSLGEPTILINNAGICHGKTILGSTEAQIRLHFEVNTLAHYWLAREFLPAMITRNHGMVVTVASQAGYITTPNMVDYSATKSAAISFHEGLAAELVARYRAPRVRTVLLTQGFTRTALIDRLTPEDTWFNPLQGAESVAEALVAQILSGDSGHVLLPGSTGWSGRAIRVLPPWMQHLVRVRLERLMRAD